MVWLPVCRRDYGRGPRTGAVASSGCTAARRHYPAKVMRLRLWLAWLFSVALLTSACGEGDGGSGPPNGGGPRVGDPGPVHVHGLGVNPKDGALFVATHTGLFRAG